MSKECLKLSEKKLLDSILSLENFVDEVAGLIISLRTYTNAFHTISNAYNNLFEKYKELELMLIEAGLYHDTDDLDDLPF